MMSGQHSFALYREDNSVVHCAPAEIKIVALVVFVVAVVSTPREMFWPYALYAIIVIGVWQLAQIPYRWIMPRMLIEVPFLILAVLLPFTDGAERITVAGLHLGVAGLWAAWGIVVKGSLGVAASLTVAATTSARELPLALTRIRLPAIIISILVLMIRYIEVLSAEIVRMRIARISRGDSPRALHQLKAIALGIGALFLRSYERGERVHMAMLSRGFNGQIVELTNIGTELGGSPRASTRQWVTALAPAVIAVGIAACARVL